MNIKEDSRVKQYLSQVCSQVKAKEVIPGIEAELLGHIEDAIGQLHGKSEEEAIGIVLAHLGEPISLGKKLHQVHKPKTEWSLILLVSMGILFGLFNLYLMQRNDLLMSRNPYFERALVWATVGILLVFAIQWVDYRCTQLIARQIYLGTLVVWILGFAFRHSVKGKPYLFFGSLQINFVDVTPYILIVALSGLLSQWDWATNKGILKGSLLGILPIVLYFLSNSFAAGITFSVVFLMLMLVSGAKKSYTLAASCLILGIGIILTGSSSSLTRQLSVFLHPDLDPSGGGWIYTRIAETVHSASWWGQGPSLLERNLPAIHTDFILTYVIYAFGWFAGLAVASMALVLVIRMFTAATRIRDLHGRLIIFGFAGIFAIQILWNVFTTVGLAPVNGLGFPFISYGGTQLISQLMAVGLILTVFRRKDMLI